MADLSTREADTATEPLAGGDGISVGRWFAGYGLALAAAGAVLAIMLRGQQWTWTWRPADIAGQLKQMAPAVKLLAFGIYISLCCTVLPLPTNAMVAMVATRHVAVTGELWTTVAAVALVGAAASTVANLNDYHLFTLALRHRHIKRVRHTRLYDVSARWLARSPFAILVIFNIIPIPIDVIRMLAVTCRYPRGRFAAANFVGRFVRYVVIAFVTFHWDLGWVAVVVLLGLAAALVLVRVAGPMVRRITGRRGNIAVAGALNTQEPKQ